MRSSHPTAPVATSSYIDESIRHGHVWSSISEALRLADKAATRARNFSVLGIIALLGLGVSVMGVAYAVVADRQSLPASKTNKK
jgi:hypothetical protein